MSLPLSQVSEEIGTARFQRVWDELAADLATALKELNAKRAASMQRSQNAPIPLDGNDDDVMAASRTSTADSDQSRIDNIQFQPSCDLVAALTAEENALGTHFPEEHLLFSLIRENISHTNRFFALLPVEEQLIILALADAVPAETGEVLTSPENESDRKRFLLLRAFASLREAMKVHVIVRRIGRLTLAEYAVAVGHKDAV